MARTKRVPHDQGQGNVTAPLTEDERRTLERFGGVVVCRCVGWPDSVADQFGAPHHSGSITWPRIDYRIGPFYHCRRTGIVIVRSTDYDIPTGKITNPLFTLTDNRIREWAVTVPGDVAERAREVSYGHYDRHACEELAEQILSPATELMLF